ncbi:MFS transporter [Streptomyces tubercidicus]|uniref:MFS transporter n=1 Tax=Streptomyces tubercidicus TaxID=47759 RepID=UPI0034658147
MSSPARRRPMRTPAAARPPAGRSRSVIARLGIPPALTWGFVGVLLFMTGDGVETGFFSKYLADQGLAKADAAVVIAVYGVTVALYGIALAGYVPISALVPALAPRHKGQAMSALNLGAGASTFAGPAVVAIALGQVGVQGIAWIFALLHLATAVAIRFLDPDPEFTAPATAPAFDDREVPAGRH